MISKVGIHPSAHFRWQRYGLEREFITKSGTDNSLPYSNLSPMEFATELLNRKIHAINNPTKPRTTHAGLGWNVSFIPQVTPDQILGFDTNTRSAINEDNGKHSQAVGKVVTTFGHVSTNNTRATGTKHYPTG